MANTKRTILGDFFIKKSANKASISRRTGIARQRLTRLSREPKVRILANEVYLIALTVGMEPGKLLDLVCNHLKVKEDTKVDGRKDKKKKKGK